MAYSRYTPGTGQAFRPRQPIAQQPQQGIAQGNALSSLGEWRQKAADANASGKQLSYFDIQEGNARETEKFGRQLNMSNTDEVDYAKVLDGIVKAKARDYSEKERQNSTGANFNWKATAAGLQEQDGLGFTRATEAGGRTTFADGNQQRAHLQEAADLGQDVPDTLWTKAGMLADAYDQQDRISGPDARTNNWYNSMSAYQTGYKSGGMGAGAGTSTPDWVVPGLADSNNPISGGSTGAPQSQGEQRQYEDLLNKQRHDPTIFQDFDRAGMSADLQKSYKKFAPTNMGAADNYNPMPPQGIMSPATGGPVGAPGQLAQRPSVFTNPMQRWTNEDGSRELKFDSNGMASGEDGRYTPASGLYMKGRPENGGKRYSSVNEYAADKGLGINDGTDPRRQYGEGQTGAGAGPIASATYDGKLNPNDVARWASQGVKGDHMDRMIASHGGVLPRTAQQDMDSRNAPKYQST